MFTGLDLSYLCLGDWNQNSISSLVTDSEIVVEGCKRLGTRFKILMSRWGQMVEVDRPRCTKQWSLNPKDNGMCDFSKFVIPGYR